MGSGPDRPHAGSQRIGPTLSLAEVVPCRTATSPASAATAASEPPAPSPPSSPPRPAAPLVPFTGPAPAPPSARAARRSARWSLHSWLVRCSLRFESAETEKAFTAYLAPAVAWRTLVGVLLVSLVHFLVTVWTFDRVGSPVGDHFARSYHVFTCSLCGFEVVMIMAGLALLYQVPCRTRPQQLKAQAQKAEQPQSQQNLQLQQQQQQQQPQQPQKQPTQQEQPKKQPPTEQKDLAPPPRRAHRPRLHARLHVHWELLSSLYICFLALTSICCNPWHIATLAGEAPDQVWGREADRFRELEAFGIVLQGSICMMYSLYVPVRSVYAIIPPISCAVSFIILLFLAGSPFPESIPGKICLHFFLVFASIPSVLARERLSRERWLATEQMLEQDGELTGMRSMSGILCDVFFKLTPSLTFCGRDGRRDSWFGSSMEGKPFLDCLPSAERERFATFIRWVSKSKTTNALHLTLLRSTGHCEVSLFAVQLHFPGDGEAQYLVSLKKNEQFDFPGVSQEKPSNPTVQTCLSESSSFELMPASPTSQPSLPGAVVESPSWAAFSVLPPAGPRGSRLAGRSQDCLSQGSCSEAGDRDREGTRSGHQEEGARSYLESVPTDLSFALSESTAPPSMSFVSGTGSPLPSSHSLRRRSRGLGGATVTDASTQTDTVETAEVGTLTDAGSGAPTPTPSARPPRIPSDMSSMTMSRTRMMNNTSSRCEPSFCWYNGHDFDGEWVAAEDEEVQHVSDWLYCLSIDGSAVLLGDGAMEHLLATEDGACFLCEGELVLDADGDRLTRFGKSGRPVHFVRSSTLFEKGQQQQQQEQQQGPQQQQQQQEQQAAAARAATAATVATAAQQQDR